MTTISNTADYLRSNQQKIITAWELRANVEVASALGLKQLVLRDSLGEILSQLADALSGTLSTWRELNAIKVEDERLAKLHASERITTTHYTLAELIIEFNILRQVIFEILEDRGQLGIQERDIILNSIERTASTSATHFAKMQTQHVEKFIFSLVHDLRNPLAISMLSVDFLRSASPERAEKAANSVQTNLMRVDTMIRQLLDIAKVRSGVGFNLEFEDTRLDTLAIETVKEMSLPHGDRFQLHTREPITGKWNRDGLRRMMENLMVNAIKYGSPDAKVDVTVEQNNDVAKLIVHNEGNPIPPEDQNALFADFQQAHQPKRDSGWGLGLALVAGMAKAHNGNVSVESSPEKGTSFTVQIPKCRLK
jgi:signal transduction histidine kinase